EGVGKLHLQFEQLKARLGREGLFDQRRKRPLPRWPRRIGVVTSPSGAVFHDMVNVVGRKFPACEIILAPALVQGEQAAASVAAALNALNQSRTVDLIVVARGGGSLEELWPFNEERVARAIFGSRVPVVSAIGHETDVTIADLVADLRAPTPSVAAELVVPDLAAERSRVQALAQRLDGLLVAGVEGLRKRVEELGEAVERNSPVARLEHDRQRLEGAALALTSSVVHALELRSERLAAIERHLRLLDPYATLERGYSITYDSGGSVVSSTAQARAGDRLQVQVSNGRIHVVASNVVSEVAAHG
ncbi:MAG: exodeoxyribonuclease VII large subunit, partial [Chloroflexota bacterium]|nr:exodeoxyribonuclease VII large subunit [Chloroflexota bacterium]